MITSYMRRLSRVICVFSILFMQGCVSKKSESEVLSSDYSLEALKDHKNIVPVFIIGSGPAGLGAALYTSLENMHTVVAAGPKPGGLLMDTTLVENWAGKQSILGSDIIKGLREQVQERGVEIIEDIVEEVDFSHWPYKIRLMNNGTVNALTVVVATGATPRKLGVPGEEEYWGRGVSTCTKCDAHFYNGEDVVIIGGGNSAVEGALQLANHASSVTMLVRKDAMRASASMQSRLEMQLGITVQYNTEVVAILGDGNQVTGVRVRDAKTGKESEIKAAGVFLTIGHTPNSALVKGQLDCDEEGYIRMIGRTQKTSVPGVAAAGEVEDTTYRQAGSSNGDGDKAGMDVLAFLSSIGFTNKVGQDFAAQGKIWRGKESSSEAIAIKSHKEFMDLSEQSEQPMVVKFVTDTCPSCKQMAPLMRALEAEFKDRISFVTVQADKAIDMVKKYHVYEVPCLLVFKKGQLLARYNKVTNKQALREFIQQFVEQQPAE